MTLITAETENIIKVALKPLSVVVSLTPANRDKGDRSKIGRFIVTIPMDICRFFDWGEGDKIKVDAMSDGTARLSKVEVDDDTSS